MSRFENAIEEMLFEACVLLEDCFRALGGEEQRMSMKVIFAGLLGATLTSAMPASAKFIGTMYYMPDVMLEMCKSDIARGQAGFCTGYVIATWERMTGAGEVCIPQGIEYGSMLRAVVGRLEVLVKENIRLAIPSATEAALRLTWPCKK